MDAQDIQTVREGIVQNVFDNTSKLGPRGLPLNIGLAVRSVELGDVQSLEVWLDEANRSEEALEQAFMPLLSALGTLLRSWQNLEKIHGTGALLDYLHCIKHSHENVIGAARILNAKRFQETRDRISGDPYWALGFA
jgi:hypothetical protein